MAQKKMKELWELYEELKQIEYEIKRVYSKLSLIEHKERRNET